MFFSLNICLIFMNVLFNSVNNVLVCIVFVVMLVVFFGVFLFIVFVDDFVVVLMRFNAFFASNIVIMEF